MLHFYVLKNVVGEMVECRESVKTQDGAMKGKRDKGSRVRTHLV